ncbi:MAG: ATPase [Peptococcaceae bacterium]|nr:ATPase [Peptococcaceae bacterium]
MKFNPEAAYRVKKMLYHLSQEIIETLPDGSVIVRYILGIGKVTGRYQYNAGLPFPNLLSMEWLDTQKFKLPNPSEGVHTAVSQLKDLENQLALEEKLHQSAAILLTNAPNSPKFPSQLSGLIAQAEGVLQRKKQLVMYGPPGTGKTGVI